MTDDPMPGIEQGFVMFKRKPAKIGVDSVSSFPASTSRMLSSIQVQNMIPS